MVALVFSGPRCLLSADSPPSSFTMIAGRQLRSTLSARMLIHIPSKLEVPFFFFFPRDHHVKTITSQVVVSGHLLHGHTTANVLANLSHSIKSPQESHADLRFTIHKFTYFLFLSRWVAPSDSLKNCTVW